MVYEANYGYVPHTVGGDGKELNAYFLGVDKAIKNGTGRCIALIHRLKEDNDQLIVIPSHIENMTDNEIKAAILFQEGTIESKIIRQKLLPGKPY